MADILMSPILSQIVPGAGAERKAQLPVKSDASFSQYLERKLRTEQAEKKNLLGVHDTKAPKPTKKNGAEPTEEPPVTVEAVLQQLMVTLKDMADKPDAGAEAGQWTFQLKDMGLLEKLAAQAGMDAASLAALKKQMTDKGGLPLTDLFAALEKNFKELGAATKVTVPETYLPLLETILCKLGVAPEVIKQLDNKGVNGVDQLDLIAYLQGLKAIPAQADGPKADPVQVEGVQDLAVLLDGVKSLLAKAESQDDIPKCVLSDFELEQLSAMLAEAGVPAAKIEAMFPEKIPVVQKALSGLLPSQGDAPVVMSLDRLKELLQQAVAAVNEARPKADPPAFFNELGTILSQAGFKSSDVGWSPVVQGTMKAAYEELQKLVSQGKGRAEKYIEIMANNDAVDQQWQTSDGSDPVLEALASAEEGGLLAGDTTTDGQQEALPLGKADLTDKLSTVGGIEMKASSQTQTDSTGKAQFPRMHLTPELQQLTVEQISQGVLRGLKNNEHHITLTLYPKELGEVKVDLQVRGGQLSAAFVMENQKVKEAMESNMEEFKDNLERRGFSLGAMSVSVGQQHHSNDSGQRFVAAWEQIKANQSRENNAVPGANPLEFIRNDQATLRQGAISLFV